MAKRKKKAKLRTDIPFREMNPAEKSLARGAFLNEFRERDFEGDIRRAKTEKEVGNIIRRGGDIRRILDSTKKRTVPLGKLPSQKSFERKMRRVKEINPRGDILAKKKTKKPKKRA